MSPEQARARRLRRERRSRIVRHAILLAWTAFIVFPIFWMVSTSFKDSGEWVTWPPHWLPHAPTLHNYAQIFAFASIDTIAQPAGGGAGVLDLEGARRRRPRVHHRGPAGAAARHLPRLLDLALQRRRQVLPPHHPDHPHDPADRGRDLDPDLLRDPDSVRDDRRVRRAHQPVRHLYRADPDLHRHHAAVRHLDDADLHRRGALHARARRPPDGRRAHHGDPPGRAAAGRVRHGGHVPVRVHPQLGGVPAGADARRIPR